VNRRRWRAARGFRGEEGYILPLAMLVLMAVGMMAAILAAQIVVNQTHVSRDQAFTKSLAVAEAGLSQYLWMIATGESSEANGFAIAGNTEANPLQQTMTLADIDDDVKGTYTILVTPPSPSDSRINITVTGIAESPTDAPRTVSATIGRPSFSEYVLLVDEYVHIGGPLTRQWYGKTHSNTGVEIDTENINDMVTCAREKYTGKDGVYSSVVPASSSSRALWAFPVPAIDFGSVTADFVRLNDLATGDDNLPYVTPSPASAAHGWYIKILPNEQYKVAQVTAEREEWNYDDGAGNIGGYLTYGSWSAARDYPDEGVIFVNDNVWVEGTNVSGRLTIAASGQFNGTGRTASINVVGDILYATKDGTAAVGLIAEENLKVPMYAPMGQNDTDDMGTNWTTDPGSVDMEIDAAIIAQTGKEFVNYNGAAGPRRNLLTFFGSVSSKLTPYRVSVASDNKNYGGFGRGANTYDSFLLHNPPPYFPTVGSYQILDWRELPITQAITTTTIP
jgi:hypothetical protein